MSSQLALFAGAAVKCRASRPDPFDMIAIDRRALLTTPLLPPRTAPARTRGAWPIMEAVKGHRRDDALCALTPRRCPRVMCFKRSQYAGQQRNSMECGDFSGELDIGEDSPK